MNNRPNSAYASTPGFGRVWERKNRMNENEKAQKAPEYDGRLTLPDGTEVRIALWRAPNGNGFNIKLSGSPNPATSRNGPLAVSRQAEPAMHDFDDEVPF